ncbi:MAG TPA: hypothetical protein VGB82_03865 [Alphaproteobacteria bacterium]
MNLASVRLAWIFFAAIAVVLSACGDAPHRARADDPYQACLDRAYRTGDVGDYGPTTLQHQFPGDRDGRRLNGLPYPSRLKWPQSPVDQCNDLRTRGLF